MLLITRTVGWNGWTSWISRRTRPRRRRPLPLALENLESRLQLSPTALLSAVPALIAQADEFVAALEHPVQNSHIEQTTPVAQGRGGNEQGPHGANDHVESVRSTHSPNSDHAAQVVRVEVPLFEGPRASTAVVNLPSISVTLIADQGFAESLKLGGPAWSITESSGQASGSVTLVLRINWFSWSGSTSVAEPTQHTRSAMPASGRIADVHDDTPMASLMSKPFRGTSVSSSDADEPLTRSTSWRQAALMEASIAPAVTSQAASDQSSLVSKIDSNLNKDDLGLPIDPIQLRRMFEILTARSSNRLIETSLTDDSLRKALVLEGVVPLSELPKLTPFSLPTWDSEIEARLRAAEAATPKQPTQKPMPKSGQRSDDEKPTPEKSASEGQPMRKADEAAPVDLPEEAGQAAMPTNTPKRSWWEAFQDPQVWMANLIAIASCVSAWPNKRQRRDDSDQPGASASRF